MTIVSIMIPTGVFNDLLIGVRISVKVVCFCFSH